MLVLEFILDHNFYMCKKSSYTYIRETWSNDKYFAALNAVEEAALNRAKEGRKKLSEIHRNPTKKQGDIWEDSQRTSSYRVKFLSHSNIGYHLIGGVLINIYF